MDLSQEQKSAVETKSEKALVLAGPGSGKTRVLISRIQHLIENEKVSPSEILAFTFTRKAAGEIKSRLIEEIGTQAHRVTMGTMHGVALDHLQRFGELIGLKPGKITVYSGWEEQYLLKEIALEMGYHTGKAWRGVKKKNLDAAFNLFYSTGIIRPDCNEVENDILKVFFGRCRENNALTYGLILIKFWELLPTIKSMIDFRHIMVDEVQDNDKLQWSVVNGLCEACGASLFVVGDLDQSIYSFRGADPEYLIRHQKEFDIYRLEANYRSDGNIVKTANALIKNNDNRLEKDMVSKKQSLNLIDVCHDADSGALVNLLSHLVLSNIESKKAVLARNHYMVKKLSRLLKEAHIDHEYIGETTALTKSEEFRKFHAFLKLVVNPFDNFSFLLIKEFLGLDLEEYGAIRIKAVKEYKSHYQAWSASFTPMDKECTWESWFKASQPHDFPTIVDWLKEVPWGFPVDHIFDFVYTWVIENPNGTVDQYLNWLATYDVQDDISGKEPATLQLMTIHAAKGLEWPTVIIAGLNEGILPGRPAMRDLDEMESERRLCYVAITRAEDYLILTSRPEDMDRDGGAKYPVSRFLREGRI